MKKFFKITGGLLCLGALASPSAGWADVVKEKAVYTYGDAQGAVSTDVWSSYDHNLFDKDGKKVRTLQLFRSANGDEISLSQKTEYVYNEAGKLTESILSTAAATSPDNVDKEYVFTRSRHDVWEYNESGQLTAQYYEQWNKKKQVWNPYQQNCYVYTYDADGKVEEEKFWRQRSQKSNGDYSDPSSTTTYEYDATGKVTKSISKGSYADYCYDMEYTYDAQGRRIHAIKTCTLESSVNYNQVVEEKEWKYDGDFLLTVTTTKNTYKKVDGVVQLISTTIKRTRNEKVENNPYRYFTYSEQYNEETDTWAMSTPVFTEHVSQDYAGMEELIPTLNVTASAANPQDMVVKFNLPTISYANYAVQVYRDGLAIKTYTKDELAAIADGSGYSFTDAGLKSGDHEYYAQLLVGDAGQTVDDMTEGYISDIATATVVINYPNVADFHIKGYVITKVQVPAHKEYDDDGNEITVPASWEDSYSLVLEWTPLTEEQVAGYGFERYEIYYKTTYSNSVVENITDLATGTVTVDWDDLYKEVWLAVKYGEDRVETAHIPIDLSQLTDLSAKDPIPAYGVIFQGGYTPAFVKIDLTKPEAAPEMIYNLYDDSMVDMLSMFGGVSVGDSYYALYEDPYGEIRLGAFDMTNKAYVEVGKAFSSLPESSFSDLLYDSQSEKLYAVAPDAESSYLYTIDPLTGEVAKSDIALPEYTLYLAAADNGTAYAMAAETGKFQLYSVDLAAGTYAKVEGVTVDGRQNTWSSLVYRDNQLYFNLNTKYYTINLADNTVTTNTDFAKGVSGITFTESTVLPEVVPVLGEYSHMLASEIGAEGVTNYYYSPWNQLERVSEFNAEQKMTKYTKNIYSEAGLLNSAEVYEPKADEYGVESMQLAQTTTYTYDNDGLLSEKSNSDGTWERYTYANGLIATKTLGNGETTEQTQTYTYDDENAYPGKPFTITSQSDTDPTKNYTTVFNYDMMGNVATECRVKDMMTGEYLSFETWEYFPNTNIVSKHNVCVPNEFDEQTGEPVIAKSTIFEQLDGYNQLMSMEFDGEGNPIENTAKQWIYSDLTDTAEGAYVQIAANVVEESANDVAISFSLPEMIYGGKMISLGFYRDGKQIGELSMDELSQMMDAGFVYTDKQVPNGEHEYFIRTNEEGMNGMTPLQISAIVDVTPNTELPVVSDIRYVKYTEAYVDENGEIDESATSGSKINKVTIGWTNPEIPETYGFTGNHVFLMDGEKPVAVGTVTDAQTNETDINVGTATEFNVMIQSRYALGEANSATQQLSFILDGVDNVTDGGFSVKVEDKSVVASEDAVISVFSTDGVRVASTCGRRLDLSAHNGTFVVTAERNGEIRIIKVIL